MGQLELNRRILTITTRQPQIQGDGSHNKTRCSPSQGGGLPLKDLEPNQGLRDGLLRPDLPKDIWWHIHSLLPLIDAARVACVSQDFVLSWRFYPNLTLTPRTLNLYRMAGEHGEIRYFINVVDSILKNHSGVGLKTFKLHLCGIRVKDDSCYFDHVDNWLKIAVNPGIEELSLILTANSAVYNFPCTLLSGGSGALLRSLNLRFCKFKPRVGFCLRSLTNLQLHGVHMEDGDLSYLLSSAPSLESLEVGSCHPIMCIRIPCLHKLSYLFVSFRRKIHLIENQAPNLSRIYFGGKLGVRFSLGSSSQRMETLDLVSDDTISYAYTELPSIMPNLRTLNIRSFWEEANAAMMPTKFAHLQFLSIHTLCGPGYDVFSLMYFLLACPSLETFILNVSRLDTHPSVFSDSSGLRTMPKHLKHDKLKSVHIETFYSAKMLVELTCQIMESARALECLTLDTTDGLSRCSVNITGKCGPMAKEEAVEARRSLLAVERYIKPKLASTVELNIVGPCDRCHAAEL